MSRAALGRAATFGRRLDEPVLAAAVVPRDNGDYARQRGWLGDDRPFDRDRIRRSLRADVRSIAPDATLRLESVGRYAPPGQIAAEIRRVAAAVDAEIVFVGSENAGRVVSSVASVGRSLATDDGYDVLIVRRPPPAEE